METASPNVWPMPELPEYLCGRLNSRHADDVLQRSQCLHLGYAEAFFMQLCLALENYCTNVRQQILINEGNEREEVLWIYAPRQIELPYIRRLACSITEPIRNILTMLLKCLSLTGDSITFDGDILQSRRGMANLGRVLNIGALIEAWRREGYHEHLLRRYAWYRMIKQAPSRQREVDLFVSELFDQPWEKRRWDQTAGKADEPDLRIHYLK